MSRARTALVLLAVVGLAVNLRPAAVSVGPLLAEVRAGLAMSVTAAGVLTSLPVLAFALVGAVAPRAARVVGPHRLALASLVVVVVGLVGRSLVGTVPAFLALSLLALAGVAAANVVLPSLVKRHFPDRVGPMTAAYSTSLALGLTAASVLSVPLAEAGGGWRIGLGGWAVLAGVALLPWLLLVGQDRRDGTAAERDEAERISFREVAGTPVGRQTALFFGLQSVQAYAIFGWLPDVYRDAGFSGRDAGLLLGVVTAMSVPLSVLVPWLTGRMADPARLVWVLSAGYPVGYLGLVLAPGDLAVLWAVVVGAATATFPLVLTLIGLRARTAAGTAALSGFAQSSGYLLAAAGPFGVGALRDATGGWTVPLLVLTALAVPLALTGVAAARPAVLEDQLRR